MIGKDEKGYVLSGLGMLLLIPVMIMIPIAISLQEQSSEIPATFVKSDTVFRAFKNIQRDVQAKTIKFVDDIDKKTYRYDQHGRLAGNITTLYNSTVVSVYQDAYRNVVDSINITPNYPSQEPVMNSTSGNIPMKNGIRLTYNFTNATIVNNSYIYDYEMSADINMTIDVVKLNARHVQSYEYSFDSQFYINTTTNNTTTAANNVNTFFDNLKLLLIPYC